ncbi:DUF3293 domain-containing protein [Falsiroseomonas oryzae]|uniref:DUF3293 domain-containing protein n=1 Tax=Falsiroseomonas oryzae TaxID=2766473 RepID=UPI0022EA3777|nr:DUF3293 domain-containing protein [Roseomonas sp. MO-31]
MHAALRSAYARTAYEAGDIVARIGRRSAALDALLLARGVRSAGFVTAWNPFSRKMPPGWNARMLDRLRQAARGRVLAEGWGRGSGWAERHLLVAGDARRLAVLAARFRQHALVAVAAGRPPRIVPGRVIPPHARDAPLPGIPRWRPPR